MRNEKERKDNEDYISKVMVPEVFIKLYSDFFHVTKKISEQRIAETPADEDDESDGDMFL